MARKRATNPNSVSKLHAAGLHIFYFFRFIQLGSAVIAGFVYCFLVWHHNNHFCALSPSSCTSTQLSYVRVPRDEIFVIAACCLTFLETYISGSLALPPLSTTFKFYYPIQLLTSLPITLVLSLSFWRIMRNPDMNGSCWGQDLTVVVSSGGGDPFGFGDIFNTTTTTSSTNNSDILTGDVEQSLCGAVWSGWIALAIAVGFSGLIVLMCAVITTVQVMKARRAKLAAAAATVATVATEEAAVASGGPTAAGAVNDEPPAEGSNEVEPPA